MKLIISVDNEYCHLLCRYLEPEEKIQIGDLCTADMEPMARVWFSVDYDNAGQTSDEANTDLRGTHRKVYFRIVSDDPMVLAMHRTREKQEQE